MPRLPSTRLPNSLTPASCRVLTRPGKSVRSEGRRDCFKWHLTARPEGLQYPPSPWPPMMDGQRPKDLSCRDQLSAGQGKACLGNKMDNVENRADDEQKATKL
ncbi:unnamed protein product [Protopolystoma xenopodis]|uniref:Uncharacterized protein n=1 Tax=Protopolystoma xenopodis TaxID=117903 RepID=A0A3S5AP05_9PLAT|nr:unnamed protein product [Protopolystoma xenopodis]